MNQMISLTTVIGCLMMLFNLFSLWSNVYLLINAAFRKRIALSAYYFMMSILLYYFIQRQISPDSSYFGINVYEHMLYDTSDDVFLKYYSLCIILFLLSILSMILTSRKFHAELSAVSIKEALDHDPAGICCFYEDGHILLRNQKMIDLYSSLSTAPMLNGFQIEETLKSHTKFSSDLDESFLSLPDGSAWMVRKTMTELEHCPLICLTITEVTEEFQYNMRLHQAQQEAEEASRRYRAYRNQIKDLTIAQETLHAKVRIHDELGALLLSCRHFLLNPQDENEAQRLITDIRKNANFMDTGNDDSAPDRYAQVLQTAQNIGVVLDIEGLLPQNAPLKEIFAVAIHECLTNTLRHAHGDLLRIDISTDSNNISAVFSNNGSAPEQPINEQGGLAQLRSMVEQNNGQMQVVSEPEFALKITFSKGVIQ